MIPKVSEKHIEHAAQFSEELLEDPSVIVGAGKIVNKEATKMMKNFFSALTGNKLYTDNMDPEQIWEQLEDGIVAQYDSLKNQVNRIASMSNISINDFIEAPKKVVPSTKASAWDSTDDETETPVSKKNDSNKNKSFADLANEQARALGLADYDDASSGDEKFFDGDQPEKIKKMKGLKHKHEEDAENALNKKTDEDEDYDEDDEDDEIDMDGDDDFEMSDDENEEEENEDNNDDEEEEEEEDKNELIDADELEDAETGETKKRARALFDDPLTGNHRGSSFADLILRDAKLDQEMDDLERSLVGDKHWTMLGEASSKSRPINSLLEHHLELPHYKKADMVEDAQLPDTLGGVDDESGIDFASKLTSAIEALVIRRVKDLNFDDVERKVAQKVLRPEDQDNEEILEFSKSKKSLAELYEDDFKNDVMGEAGEVDKATQKQHEEITKLLSKLFYSMDAIANHRHSARPSKISAAAVGADMKSMIVEDAIPVTLSTSRQKTPEEIHAVGHEKKSSEMDHDERKALRSAKKRRRTAKVGGQLHEGELNLKGMRERQEKLETKNKQASDDRKAIKATGLTSAQAEREKNRLHKKINTTDLLARASALNSFKVQTGVEKKSLKELASKPSYSKKGRKL